MDNNTKYFSKQITKNDCGYSVAASIISYFYKSKININVLKNSFVFEDEFLTLSNLDEIFEKFKINSDFLKGNINDLLSHNKLPIICHTKYKNMFHYIIVIKINKNTLKIFDPMYGFREIEINYFKNIWSEIIIEFNHKEKINFKETNFVNESLQEHSIKILLYLSLTMIILVFGFFININIFSDVLNSIASPETTNPFLLIFKILGLIILNQILISIKLFLYINTKNSILIYLIEILFSRSKLKSYLLKSKFNMSEKIVDFKIKLFENIVSVFSLFIVFLFYADFSVLSNSFFLLISLVSFTFFIIELSNFINEKVKKKLQNNNHKNIKIFDEMLKNRENKYSINNLKNSYQMNLKKETLKLILLNYSNLTISNMKLLITNVLIVFMLINLNNLNNPNEIVSKYILYQFFIYIIDAIINLFNDSVFLKNNKMLLSEITYLKF